MRQRFEPSDVGWILLSAGQIPPEAEDAARCTLAVVNMGPAPIFRGFRGSIDPEHDFFFGRTRYLSVAPTLPVCHVLAPQLEAIGRVAPTSEDTIVVLGQDDQPCFRRL